MRSLMAAMRYQALESFPFMLLPEEAFMNPMHNRNNNNNNDEIDPDNMNYEVN
jgi:hypothetical protein